jgi:hypothetical protein
VGGGRGAGAVKGVKKEEEGVVWSSAARSDISTVRGSRVGTINAKGFSPYTGL